MFSYFSFLSVSLLTLVTMSLALYLTIYDYVTGVCDYSESTGSLSLWQSADLLIFT